MDPTPAPRTRSRRDSAGWVIGRGAGAPIVIAPTWLIGAAILVFLFSPTVAQILPGARIGVALTSVVFVLILFGSVLLHELAHAFAARSRGHRVHKIVLTAWGGHTTYDSSGTTPGGHFLIAVSGPAINLLLAGIFWLGYRGFIADGIWDTSSAVIALLVYAGAITNGFVGVFNLLPSIPLDGGMLLEAVIWKITGDRFKGTVVGAWLGRALAVGVVLWVVASPLLRGQRPEIFSLMWAILIAALLWGGAGRALAGSRRNRRVEALQMSTLLEPAIPLEQTTSVAVVLGMMESRGTRAVVLVDYSSGPVAVVEGQDARTVPAEQRSSTPASAVATRLVVAPMIDADLTGSELLSQIQVAAQRAPVLVVRGTEGIVGFIRVSDVIRLINQPR